MRYIAVFAQQKIGYAVGFDTYPDATDFLYWGYEAYDLLPYGTFDVQTGEVWPYEHQGACAANVNEQLISRTALDYLQAAVRQTK